jgi:hypothetical protein
LPRAALSGAVALVAAHWADAVSLLTDRALDVVALERSYAGSREAKLSRGNL